MQGNDRSNKNVTGRAGSPENLLRRPDSHTHSFCGIEQERNGRASSPEKKKGGDIHY